MPVMDPSSSMDMMKSTTTGTMAMLIPQLFIMGWVNFFFSGFILGKAQLSPMLVPMMSVSVLVLVLVPVMMSVLVLVSVLVPVMMSVLVLVSVLVPVMMSVS